MAAPHVLPVAPALSTPPRPHRLTGHESREVDLLFIVAAFAEIGGAWLIWQGVREHRGLLWIGAGVIALGLYGFVATLQPDANFGRILAAYGGIFVAGSFAWGMVVDKFRPDRWTSSARSSVSSASP